MLIYIGIFQDKGERIFEASKEPINMSKIYSIGTAKIL
jgi:hypothetical protein